ncbi:MAG: Lrp/AsnC family transcriptional regulator [Thaumarchaeota archaeon]|jgi:DNA-binding Lrp family transcriptional regulator|nr:Lrp/AsnC family transcriptional regulator [Candidatus Geocrenenecus arthurdayi]MCL7391552.1 Lrp/AsnC family transcriptional regulator [Candidatus Geocrenenecus arthurdayi]MCL7404027.1 Lrp/AsnC family transcriptional regulator [Candidatus Geocrenenecus arthurdayi]
MDLDEKDKLILRELWIDSSQSVREIAEKLGMPRTTVQERINKMKREGIIKRFTIEIDYSKLGKSTTAFILVSFMPGPQVSQKELARRISELPDVEEVHLITGEWDIIVKVRGSSIKDIGDLVVERIRTMDGVARTVTCAAFYTAKE